MTTERQGGMPKQRLNLFDSTNIIVGIIIGAAIYESSPTIAKCMPGVGWLIVAWLVGGLLSLVGALCYVELGNAYPREGGDYVYIHRAFGRHLGFLFAWAQLWVVRPGSIGAMAYIFARYAHHLAPIFGGEDEYIGWLIYAAGSVVVLTLVNIAGVQQGKWTQNVLTSAKVLGLLGVAAIGLSFTSPNATAAPLVEPEGKFDWNLAMILILFAYGGWSEMGYVAAEVKNPKKNLLWAMMLGTLAVAAVYIVVNLAFVHALGLDGVRKAETLAADVVQLGLTKWGDRFISLLICVSALSAVNGQIFTGARIYYATGRNHRLFRALGSWNEGLGTPILSLVIQAGITLATVLGFGAINHETLTKASFGSGFESMVIFTGPLFWGFLVLVSLSVLVLRTHEPDVPRPYRVPLYPLIPFIFLAFSLFMMYSSTAYAIFRFQSEAYWALTALGVGVLASLIDRPTGGDNA